MSLAIPFPVLSAVLLLSVLPGARAAVLHFDFGGSGVQAAAPYNNVHPAQLTVANALDSTSTPTGISLTASGFNPTSTNGAGTTTPTGSAAIFNSASTQDSMFGHANVWGTTPAYGVATLVFSNLDLTGNTYYTFDFFGSRNGAPVVNRETEYAVSGLNSGSAFLDVQDNSTRIATVTNIQAAPDGTITVRLDPGPNNTSTEQFYYIGALRLTTAPVPEPTAAGLLLLTAGAALRRRR